LISSATGASGLQLRHGAKHDIYHNPELGISQPVPRHREINERLAKKILRDLTGK